MGLLFVRRKVTTSKSKPTTREFAEAKKEFLDDDVSTVTVEEIPPELVLNWYSFSASIWLDNGSRGFKTCESKRSE